MSGEKKAFSLDFLEPPKAERRGREPYPIYMNTINAFSNSGKDYAKVNIPREMLEESEAKNPIQTFKSGLTNAVKRLNKQNEIKVITRKNNLYLITKTYSDKQGWVWKVTRRRK